jgi:hypothetical protein
MSSPTTALASSTNPTPTRRSSWKDKTNAYHPITPSLSEKHCSTTTTTQRPFSDTPSSSSSVTDIEAQADDLPFKPKPKKRSKYRMCILLLCFITFWAVLIVGFVFLLDTVFPGAVRYDKLRELKSEMLDTEKTVDMLKAQVGGLVAYIGSLGGNMVNGQGGMSRGGDGTMFNETSGEILHGSDVVNGTIL